MVVTVSFFVLSHLSHTFILDRCSARIQLVKLVITRTRVAQVRVVIHRNVIDGIAKNGMVTGINIQCGDSTLSIPDQATGKVCKVPTRYNGSTKWT